MVEENPVPTNFTTSVNGTAANAALVGQTALDDLDTLVAYLQGNPAMSWTYWALNGEDSYGLLDSNYDPTPPSSAKQTLLQSIQYSQSGVANTNAPD